MKIKDIPNAIKRFIKFITEDIWRTNTSELSKKKRRGYNILQVIYLALRRYQEDKLQKSASALTYSTFLSVIPLLAVLLSIAKGFGFDNIIQSQLFQYFPGQREALESVFSFIDSYMQHTKDGVFLGLGIVLLLYTVLNLIINIESTLNSIWQVQKGRSYIRRITDYFSILILLPVFIICISGITIFMTTTFETLNQYEVFAPIYNVILRIVPIVITILFFTILYMFMPNTKVLFKNAFVGAIFAGIGFQLFQYLYISGQMWVSKYNAIYGSFAFIPLLLLWIQLSWVICLIGAEISYASQNVQNYAFETESKNITRRYYDFFVLIIMALIIKRFESGEKAFTANELAHESKIPIRLTNVILYKLIDLGMINEIQDEDDYPNFQPAMDINKITVGYLYDRLDREGSENFKVDYHRKFRKEWETILKSRENMFPPNENVLVKDLIV